MYPNLSNLSSNNPDAMRATHSYKMNCPSCKTEAISAGDNFCRKCGLRVQMTCSKCHQAVRPNDSFCGSCGARRWKWLELWRFGQLHQSPESIACIALILGASWLTLYLYLSNKRKI